MRTRLPAVLLLAALLACASRDGLEADLAPSGACSELHVESAPRPRDVVLVVADTLRRDYLGIYGGEFRTPAFDAFARQGLWFDDATTQAPWTLPSIATLFTSLYPSQHHVSISPLPEVAARALERRTEKRPPSGARRLPRGLQTLAETLGAAGYRTAAFVTNPWVSEKLGFAQGFQVFDASRARWDAPGGDLSEAAVAWMRDASDPRPRFLYVHYMDAHRPYPAVKIEVLGEHLVDLLDEKPAADPVERGAIANLIRIEGRGAVVRTDVAPSRRLLQLAYGSGVENFDRALDVLLRGLAGLPGAEERAVVVTSDHGEALFERGYGNHGLGLYDEEVAVPLAMQLPGVRADGHRVDCPVGLIDLAPTLCAYLGVSCPATMQGIRLLPGAEPSAAPRYVISEGVANQPRHRAIRTRRWKLLYEPDHPAGGARESPWALFDTREDPDERRDLLARGGPGEARRAYAVLSRALLEAAREGPAPKGEPTELDDDLRERLEVLGYADRLDAASPGR